MNFKQNVSEIKRLFQEKKETAQAILRFLVSKGISPSIAEGIIVDFTKDDGDIAKIQKSLSERINVASELSFTSAHKLAFVGPTGVGKTTLILKLAEHYQHQNRNIALLTLDSSKKQSLKEWSITKKIQFTESPYTPVDLLLIDTEGCNFYLPERVDSLGEKIAEMGEGIEVVLTLSAAAKEVDLYGAVHQFSALCPTSLAFTKLDETLAAGVLVNVSAKTDLPIRYVAYGYPLPGEVQLADPIDITHKILTDFNNQEFHFLRQLTLSTLN